MALNDIIEVVLDGLCNAQRIINVWHFKQVNALADFDDLAVHLNTVGGPVDKLVRCICNDYALVDLLLTKVSPAPRGPQETYSVTFNQVTQGTTAGVLTASMVIKWSTAQGGRSGRGRTYIGPIRQDGVMDGVLNNDEITKGAAVITAMNNYFEPTGENYDGDFNFGVYSRKNDAFYPMTSAQVRTQAKTQRRRQLGVGA